MKSDIEIAREGTMIPITEVAASIGLTEDDIETYGKYKAKVSQKTWDKVKNRPDGKLILVTAITPTPAGEGKTTTSVGLGMGLNKIGKKTVIALREPSLGPVFGVKGGAAGGGYAQVVPMEDINLHFTGDLHAITTAHNLLAALLDNSIHQGNPHNIDPRQVVWRRVMDMNERQLRNIVCGLGGKASGVPRESGFDITASSEVMASLCMASDLMDLKERFKRIVVAYTYDGKPVTAGDLNAAGAMTVVMRDAIKPNLVQTLENTPAFIHGGPFANIAHGCNSVMATQMGLKLGDYLVTEAGFGADLGAEKFFDLKCRFAGFKPNAVVLVATIRALKMHGGIAKDQLNEENLQALEKGMSNLEKHLSNLQKFGMPVVVAVNEFPTDSQAEVDLLIKKCTAMGAEVSLSQVWAKGGDGAIDLAHKVVAAAEKPSSFKFLYDAEQSIKTKMETICKEYYSAGSVSYDSKAEQTIKKLEQLGYGNLPICIAKTQFSFSEDPNLKGAPSGFNINIREVKLSAGAGFIVALVGSIMVMPGLGKVPSAEKMDVQPNGDVVGLF